ncbi:MAG: FliG C-terminal domain-containing protein [Pseudomonadota bacterium]
MGLQICQDDMATGDGMTAVADQTLTSRQKAAVIVRLLLNHDVSPGLDRLSPKLQTHLAHAMANLGPVSRATLARVVQDFTGQLDALGLTRAQGLTDVLPLLEPHISPIARDDLRAQADRGDGSDPWSRLSAMDAPTLAPLLQQESAEVAAILLSKLSVAKAAALLADLPDDRAEVIAHSVSLTGTVTPDMVDRIGAHLLWRLQAVPERAFNTSPADRVGAILNAVPGQTRDALLEALTGRDKDFGDGVRRAIFTFHHIPKRVEGPDVPRILRRVDPDVMKIALAAGLKEAPVAVEFILESMSKRLAEQLRDEVETLGTPKEAEGEAAMAEVVNTIRLLEEEGELRLIVPDE